MKRAKALRTMTLMTALSLLCIGTSQAADRHAGRRMMAARYEMHGLVDKAVAEYIRILAKDPEDPGARARIEMLTAIEMPTWLPEEAGVAFPLPHEVLVFSPRGGPAVTEGAESGAGAVSSGARYLGNARGEGKGADAGGAPVTYRALVTAGSFAAREGVRWDELHEKGFSLIDYAYVLHPIKKRYELRVAVHTEAAGQAAIAQQAMRATLACYLLAKDFLGMDPTGRWGDPIDVWIADGGDPGARAQGRSIYLYSVQTPRDPAEWLREIGHEYGHVCLPGIGGFEDTDDPWADGHLAELLFPKWLSAVGTPEWMPWSVTEWEARAEPERERLMEGARGMALSETLLKATDAAARDFFLGTALNIEREYGAEQLGNVLAKCPQGNLERFLAAAREVGVWHER